MYILRPDEKTTPVMLYTKESVIRGELVTKQLVHRINIWLRTDGVPKYLHLLKTQVLVIGGGSTKALSYPEIFFPSGDLIAFHTLPPTEEPLDYEPAEANRMMVDLDVLAGTFIMQGKVRISSQTEVGTSLEVARITWMSFYDVSITNPHLPQMSLLKVPMVLVNPNHVAYAVNEQT